MTYEHDPRVVQVDATHFELPDDDGVWTVVRENGLWNAYDQAGRYCAAASGMVSADDVFAAVLGAPQVAA